MKKDIFQKFKIFWNRLLVYIPKHMVFQNIKKRREYFENFRKPRGFFVPRSGQFRYGIIFALIVGSCFLGLLSTMIAMHYFPNWLYCAEDPALCEIIKSQENLFSLMPALKSILLFGIPCIIIAFFLGLFVAHSTFGPTVRINKHIEHLTNGNYSHRITLRKKDQLNDIAEKLNTLSEQLEKTKR